MFNKIFKSICPCKHPARAIRLVSVEEQDIVVEELGISLVKKEAKMECMLCDKVIQRVCLGDMKDLKN